MSPEALRAMLRRQPFVPFRIHLADQRSFLIHHPDYLILPPEMSTTAFVFQRGGKWDIIYLRQITSVSSEGELPAAPTPRSREGE